MLNWMLFVEELVGVSLGVERCMQLVKLGKILKECIIQGPTRETKITPGIINRGNSMQEVGYPSDRKAKKPNSIEGKIRDYQEPRVTHGNWNQESRSHFLHPENVGLKERE